MPKELSAQCHRRREYRPFDLIETKGAKHSKDKFCQRVFLNKKINTEKTKIKPLVSWRLFERQWELDPKSLRKTGEFEDVYYDDSSSVKGRLDYPLESENKKGNKDMARRRKNFGGFSWKRLTGVTRAKQSLSRKLGIPLTKSGRQRKIGKATGGCLVSLLFIAILGISPMFGYVLNINTKKVHTDNCHEIEKMLPEHYQYSNTPSVPGYTNCLKCNSSISTILGPAAQPSTRQVVPAPAVNRTAPDPAIPVAPVPAVYQTTPIPAVRPATPVTQWTPGKTAWTPGTPLPVPVTERITPQPTEKPPLEWGWVKVQRVIDGDTLLLENGQSVRLIGADTPETVKPGTPVQPFGKEASEFTKRCIERGENWVFLEEDGDKTDRYGRQLAMVYIKIYNLNDPENKQIRLLNDMLILSGLARARTEFNYSQEMKDKFTQSEKDAREQKRIIWSQAQ